MTHALRQATNYHRWLFEQICPYVGRKVLEVGAGSGNMTAHLAALAPVTALDVSATAIAFLRTRLAGVPNVSTLVADIGDEGAVQRLAGLGFDTIVTSNVLEHIADDARAIAHAHAVLAPRSGVALVIVPAMPSIYGTLDEAAGHVRRYGRRDLVAKFAAAGFRV